MGNRRRQHDQRGCGGARPRAERSSIRTHRRDRPASPTAGSRRGGRARPACACRSGWRSRSCGRPGGGSIDPTAGIGEVGEAAARQIVDHVDVAVGQQSVDQMRSEKPAPPTTIMTSPSWPPAAGIGSIRRGSRSPVTKAAAGTVCAPITPTRPPPPPTTATIDDSTAPTPIRAPGGITEPVTRPASRRPARSPIRSRSRRRRPPHRCDRRLGCRARRGPGQRPGGREPGRPASIRIGRRHCGQPVLGGELGTPRSTRPADPVRSGRGRRGDPYVPALIRFESVSPSAGFSMNRRTVPSGAVSTTPNADGSSTPSRCTVAAAPLRSATRNATSRSVITSPLATTKVSSTPVWAASTIAPPVSSGSSSTV